MPSARPFLSLLARIASACVASAACLVVVAPNAQRAAAATIDWSSTAGSTTWATGSNWLLGTAPADDLLTDIARFDQTSYALMPDAGTRSVSGLLIGDGTTVTAPLTISGTTLNLGFNGINMLSGANGVTISPTTLNLGMGQTWTNASGSTLAINPTNFTRAAGSTLNIVNAGTGSITSSALGNDVNTNIIGAWATFGTGANTRYATMSGSTVGAYTGTSVNSSATFASNATANANLESSTILLAPAGSLSFNTLRYGGAQTTYTVASGNTWTTNGILNAGTGTLTIGTGTLAFGSTGELVLNAASAGITIGTNITGSGVISIAGPNTVNFNQSLAVTAGGTLVINPGSTLQVNFNTTFNNITSTVLNGGTISIQSNGAQGAFGNGDLTINGGTITRSLGGSANFLPTSATQYWNGDFNVAGGISLPLNGAVLLGGNRTVNVTNSAGGGFTLNGAIGDNSKGYGLTKTGSGAMVLGAANTFSGPFNVNAGTVYLNATSTQSSTVVSINSGATMVFNGGSTSGTYAGLNDGASGGGTINYTTTSGTSTLTLVGGGSYSFGGTITNAAGRTFSVSKTGSGTQVLSGSNSYIGSTTVSNGTLQIGNGNSLGYGGQFSVGSTTTTIANSGATVSTGGTIDLSGQTVNEPLTLSGGSLVNNNTAAAARVDNGVAGITTTGTNANFSAGTTVSLTGGGGSGAGAAVSLGITTGSLSLSGGTGYKVNDLVNVSGGGGTGAVIKVTTIDASGGITGFSVSASGSGFTGAPTGYSGGSGSGAAFAGSDGKFTVVAYNSTAAGTGYTSAPTVAFSSGGVTGTAVLSSVALTNATTSSIGGDGGLTIAAPISGSGNLQKVGNGTTTLTNTNTYIGTTAVNAGTLLVNGNNSAATGAVTVAASARLGGTGTIGGAVNVLGNGTLRGGDGTAASGGLTAKSNVTLNDGAVIELVLGSSGAHSSLIRTGGTWIFDADQAFRIIPATGGIPAPQTYDNIITGLTGSEAGLATIATWNIITPQWSGTFSLDGSNNVDLNVTATPEPASLGLLAFGGAALLARRRRSA